LYGVNIIFDTTCTRFCVAPSKKCCLQPPCTHSRRLQQTEILLQNSFLVTKMYSTILKTEML
jgi:hypothetical protein